ncbi:MAG: M48 family metalloprotease [Acidobacteria bacterium]|nr:M48 family metalloprotease [Acidobacteriota bacterium]
MGRSYARRVETTSTLVADPMVTEYMNRVTQNLVRNSDTQIPFAVKVINSDDVNAFSLPGGFLFVNSGLILATDDEAELAGAISHEVAHVAACHAAQEMAREELTNLAAMPLILRLVVRHITLNTSYFKIDRSFESEADFLGVEYMYKAGYDPQALSSFFEKLQNMGPHQPGERARAFEFHSQMADRIDKIQKEINALLPPLPQYKLDTSDFRAIKQRLSEVQNYEVNRNHGGKRIARDGPLPE